MVRRARQLEFRIRSWGGRRRGAGRPSRSGRRSVPHVRRDRHDARCPAHVTLRVADGLPSLRRGAALAAVQKALAMSSRETFRLVHFSVQRDHVHLLVEANDTQALARGCQGLAIRVAKAVNRVLGRAGAVWADRYHARMLSTPRVVRHCLVYILQNWRKHVPGARGIDPCSSGPWFRGWRTQPPPPGRCPVAEPHTWLVRLGWHRHGRIALEERPRVRRG
jgi:REP element-mobilizing transposase RayT